LRHVTSPGTGVVQQADWIIDLGPDGGKDGGEIVFTGTPRGTLDV